MDESTERAANPVRTAIDEDDRKTAARWARAYEGPTTWTMLREAQEARIAAMLPLVREARQARADALVEHSSAGWAVVAEVGKALGLPEDASVKAIVETAQSHRRRLDEARAEVEDLTRRLSATRDRVETTAKEAFAAERERDEARAEIARLKSAPGEAVMVAYANVRPLLLSASSALGMMGGPCERIDALVKALDAAVESPAPALTEEEARDVASEVARGLNARWSIGLGELVIADMTERLTRAITSRGDIPAEVRTVDTLADVRPVEPMPTDRLSFEREVKRATMAGVAAGLRQIRERMGITREQASSLIRAGWCDNCPHREQATCPDQQCPKMAVREPAQAPTSSDLLADHVAAAGERATDAELMRLATHEGLDLLQSIGAWLRSDGALRLWSEQEDDAAGLRALAARVEAWGEDAPDSVDPADLTPEPWRPAPAARLCVAVLVTDPADRVALIESAKPGRGWELPGGGVKEGEEPRAAAVREVAEEMGLQLAEDAIEYVLRLDGTPKPGATYTSRILVYRARASCKLRAGSDAKEAMWWTAEGVRHVHQFGKLSDLASRDVLLAWAREQASGTPTLARDLLDKLPHGPGGES